jgi:hypothetical protein
MDLQGTYLQEFKALLYQVTASEKDVVTRLSSIFLENGGDGKDPAYNSRKREFNNLIKDRYRHTIYLSIVSYTFIEKFSFIKIVDLEEFSEYQKMVVIMSIVGFEAKEIATTLNGPINSIKELQHRHKTLIATIKSSLPPLTTKRSQPN